MGKGIASGYIPPAEITVCDGCFHKDVCGDKDYLTENACSAKAGGCYCRECKCGKPYERTDRQTGYYCSCPRNTFTYGANMNMVFEPVREADDSCSYGEPREAQNGG